MTSSALYVSIRSIIVMYSTSQNVPLCRVVIVRCYAKAHVQKLADDVITLRHTYANDTLRQMIMSNDNIK